MRLTGPDAVTNGGSAVLHVELSAPAQDPMFVVQHDGDSGFHTVVGSDPDGDGSYDIRIQVAAEASRATLLLRVAPTDGAGNIGEYAELQIELVQSGTGDVKITLSFESLVKPDRHVWIDTKMGEDGHGFTIDLEDWTYEGSWDNTVATIDTSDPSVIPDVVQAWLRGEPLEACLRRCVGCKVERKLA